jgi:hypothetical protein
MRKYDAFPESKRADIRETFTKQKKTFNNIISEIKGTIVTSILSKYSASLQKILHLLFIDYNLFFGLFFFLIFALFFSILVISNL